MKSKERLSYSQKNKDEKSWYKEWADMLDVRHYDVPRFKHMKVNYDLFNNILNLEDFEYVCNPYGTQVGELPAAMVNRDIVSGKIKVLLGMEMKRPFSWNVIATNAEATSRKEAEEFNRMRDYVIEQIMSPIQEQFEQEQAMAMQGQEQLPPEQMEQIQQQVQAQLEAQTPQEVRRYMQREHQDPAEAMSTQLLNYLIHKLELPRKFNNAFKHALISGVGVMYVGIVNDEPDVWNVNSLRFNCDKSPDLDYIEDGEWATCEYRMSPSEIVKRFGKELQDDEIDLIYQHFRIYSSGDLFSIDEFTQDYDGSSTIPVLHCTWKALRKIGFLKYVDAQGLEQEMMVDESYKMNKDFGDISIDWEWIPEVYETWKIKCSDNIYVNMQPVHGQFKDLDNLYHCKLPYYGLVHDNMNSIPTSLMDRLKVYQYYYNIVMYRLELLLASDKGKKVLMNIGAIPSNSGLDLEKWQYFFESTPFMWYDPQQEGSTYNDANTISKVIDLSLASDIQKYMEIAEYLRTQAGRSVGITDQVEGQIGNNEAVTNTRQSLVQSSHILEMYFEMHNYMKRNVMQALIETSKVAYSRSKPQKLSYVFDDLSIEMFNLDLGLLEDSTLGLFVSNTYKTEEVKEIIKQLTHAALQNQKVELSDVIAVLRQESVIEAEETLKTAEAQRMEQMQKMQEEQTKAQQQEAERSREFAKELHEMEKEKIILKEEERRKTVTVQSSLMGLSFNPQTDQDGDGVPDFLELAKKGLDTDIRKDKVQLEKEKFEHKKETDAQKLSIERLKMAQKNQKMD